MLLLFHLLTTAAKLLRPGGSRAVIAESPLLKKQLIFVVVTAANTCAPVLCLPVTHSLFGGSPCPWRTLISSTRR